MNSYFCIRVGCLCYLLHIYLSAQCCCSQEDKHCTQIKSLTTFRKHVYKQMLSASDMKSFFRLRMQTLRADMIYTSLVFLADLTWNSVGNSSPTHTLSNKIILEYHNPILSQGEKSFFSWSSSRREMLTGQFQGKHRQFERISSYSLKHSKQTNPHQSHWNASVLSCDVNFWPPRTT